MIIDFAIYLVALSVSIPPRASPTCSVPDSAFSNITYLLTTAALMMKKQKRRYYIKMRRALLMAPSTKHITELQPHRLDQLQHIV